jgi:hypothetical protein
LRGITDAVCGCRIRRKRISNEEKEKMIQVFFLIIAIFAVAGFILSSK